MKIGDKVRFKIGYASNVLADTLADLEEGDITLTKYRALKHALLNRKTLQIKAKEDCGFIIETIGKPKLTFYGQHATEDLERL